MKNTIKLCALIVVAFAVVLISAGFKDKAAGTPSCCQVVLASNVGDSTGNTAGNDKGGEYILKHEWPEKPKVGSYTLKVNLVDKSGKSVEGVEVAVKHDMPKMRCNSGGSGVMKQNNKGDYLLPINFAMRGDWRIVISARKEGIEIATKTILLNI